MDSFAQSIKDFFGKVSEKARNFFEKYDVESWPGFVMFFVVVTLGVSLNYITLAPTIGNFPALMVSLLFEIGIMAWKFQSWRKKNSVRQYEIANISTWLLVALGIVMVVVNLFRATLLDSTVIITDYEFDSWTIAAYAIIGGAAFIHVVGYLLFDQSDSDKRQRRDVQKAVQKDRNADNAIKNAETDLKIIHKIVNELREGRRILWSTRE